MPTYTKFVNYLIMACPFIRNSNQSKVSNPNVLEIDLACACKYIPTLPNQYVSQNNLLGYPVYLRNTVFHTSHMQKIRTLGVEAKLAAFDDFIKEGNKFYHLEDYDRALDCYEHAYGLFKYIEGKGEGNMSLEHYDVVITEAKIDSEIEIRNKALITVLSNFTHTFVKLRNFKEAGEAVKESLELKPNDPDLLIMQAKIRLCNLSYKNLPKVLKSIKKVVKINQKFEFMLQKYKENLEARNQIIEKIYSKIISSYVKSKWEGGNTVSVEKELEHKIVEKMQEKYYEMIEFYLENNKSSNLNRVREELKELQMVLFKMDLAFSIDGKDEKFLDMLYAKNGSKEVFPDALDSVKRFYISIAFNERKLNEQMLAYCIEKCSEEEERKKQKTVSKNNWGWIGYFLLSLAPVVVGGILYRSELGII